MSRKDDRENRSNQMNPNNDAYWAARGYEERPDDWEDQATSQDQRRDQTKSAAARKK